MEERKGEQEVKEVELGDRVAGRVGRGTCSAVSSSEEVVLPTQMLTLSSGCCYSECPQFLSQRSEMIQGPSGPAGSAVGCRQEARAIHC